MSTQVSINLAERVQHLLQERRQHTAAIERIDGTLAKVSSALGGGAAAGKHVAAAPVKPAGAKRRRKLRKFATTAAESILQFVRERKNPTTKDIAAHWKSQGRGGRADNTLYILVKGKKLKRQPIPGELGSRYLPA